MSIGIEDKVYEGQVDLGLLNSGECYRLKFCTRYGTQKSVGLIFGGICEDGNHPHALFLQDHLQQAILVLPFDIVGSSDESKVDLETFHLPEVCLPKLDGRANQDYLAKKRIIGGVRK